MTGFVGDLQEMHVIEVDIHVILGNDKCDLKIEDDSKKSQITFLFDLMQYVGSSQLTYLCKLFMSCVPSVHAAFSLDLAPDNLTTSKEAHGNAVVKMKWEELENTLQVKSL